MAMMRTRTKSRGMCLCLLGIALALLVQPSTDFARGVPGLKDSILAKRHPLHAGVARRAGAAQEDNSGQDRLDLEEVVAEADRVLEDNGTAKETKAVLRKAQKIYPGKWTLSGLKDELQQKLREFVEEAKAASKGLKEDLVLARQQQASAQRQVETAQQQVEMVMKSLVKAAARLEKAEESGTKEEVKEAKEEVKEAKEEVKEAKEEVEKAEKKVEKAERKVERAKKEVKEAKASGRTKESEASGIKDDPDATAFIQELVNAKPKDLGEGVQVFDLKTCLPAEPYDPSGRKLLTRNTTRQAWQATFELMKDGTRRVAMLGTPGIGKSRSLALGLWHLVSGHRPDWIKEPEAIVFEAREGLKVFIFSKNEDGRWKGHSLPIGKWDASDCEHLQNSDNWYLVDTYGKETTGKLPAKTVKACSPDREHYTDFVKSGGACVYVEQWKKAELELAYVHFAQPPVDKDTVLRRFQYVGGNLRALLDDNGGFRKYLQDQYNQADDWKGLQPAFGGVLDNQGNKLLTRLFTYVTVDGKIGTAQVVSPKAAEVIADKHYDKLADLWTKNDPRARYWFEDFLGPLLTCSWFPKKFDAYHITDKSSQGKANWERTPCNSLVIDAGLQLLRCDTKDIFERKWSQAVKNGSLDKCLLQSPERYAGVDYLLGLNHGISATTGPKHSIAKSFLDTLRDIFQHCKGQYSFTLSFFTTGDPANFAPKSGEEFRAFMEMAQGRDKVFKNVFVQVVQVPKTRNSMEKV